MPGEATSDGDTDPRWQAVIEVSEYISDDPDAVWAFIERWGQHRDQDLRTAIATCALEHLLESHFDTFFPRVEALARTNALFADTFSRCWKLGQAAQGERSRRFDALRAERRRVTRTSGR